ncbi:Mne1p LALA0_S14e00826g [Lachancea lanzarotensis]|uniref:LALA0S14e00826g1_1 n=1 Tax=Lachancea lanzarotensis TaxID=1245769 RepID=A0A0C7MXW9_9SACH|nr:uncharacterized protein LALA0_S14e00826g [Lachancea lanzarotensis]CEP64856.1 LALA0S14e00826g1_1 [Lachancea lanzarotensis]
MQRYHVPMRSFQDFTARIIGGDKLVRRLGRSVLRSPAAATLSHTDIWLREALVTGRRMRSHKVHKHKEILLNGQAELSLNVVLNTLRKLRLTKNGDAYFTLLNRLQSNQIRWISKKGSYIVDQTPVELYRELSHMLRATSSNSDDRADITCLANFTLTVLEKYSEILETRATLSPDLVFWQNCSIIVARTGSIHYLQHLLELAKGKLPISFAYIAFYLQTNQISHLSSVLRTAGLTDLQFLSKGLVLQSIDKFLSLGLDDDAEGALNILINQNSLDYSTVLRLNHLSERYGAFKMQLALNKVIKSQKADGSVPWKTFQKDLSFEHYIKLLGEAEVQPFGEQLPVDFLSTKLPTNAMSINQWCSLFQNSMPAENAWSSLKALHFNTVLSHVASHRSFSFVILLWHRLIMDRGCIEAFMDSHKLANHKGKNGFHILLHAAGRSSAAKLAGYELFCFMKTSNSCKLTEQDYANLMLSTLHGGDNKTVYIYLRHYILDFGKECLRLSEYGNHTWKMAASVESVINKLRSTGERPAEVENILKRVAAWHLDHHSANDFKIPDKILKDIFGDLYLDHLSPRRILSLEAKWRKQNESPVISSHHYSLVADWDSVERVRLTLDYMRSQKLDTRLR